MTFEPQVREHLLTTFKLKINESNELVSLSIIEFIKSLFS
jgi:hypothetical protein